MDKPLIVEEAADEPTTEEKGEKKKRLNRKQPPPMPYLKTLVAEPADDDSDDEGDVTKTITLQEVYQDFEEWISAMKAELDSQYTKECLIPRNLEEVKELQRTSDKKVKILPAKLVATKKKKARKPVRNKARIVACGCYDHDEAGTKETYAGGANITAIRSAIRTAALMNWP